MKKISLLLNFICFYSIGGELHNAGSFSLNNFNLPNLHNLKILASEYCSQFGEVEFTVNSTSGSLYYDCKSKCCNETLRTVCHRLFSQDKDYFNRIWSRKQLDEQLDEIILFQQFLSEKFFSGDIHAVSFDSSVTKNVLLKLIEEEKESIDIAIFKLTDPDIIVALKEAAHKNVKVRIIVNKSTSNAYNIRDLNSFENFQVNFYESKEKEILHHKYILFGKNLHNKKILVNGSANLSQAINLEENTIFTENKDAYLAFCTNFQELLEGLRTGNFKFNNPEIFGDRIYISCSFTNFLIKERLLNLIRSEQKAIKVATMYLSDFDIIDALKNAKYNRGVDVCVIAMKFGYNIVNYESPNIHSKYAIFDKTLNGRRVLFMGSGNFSKSAFDNLENCIILDTEQIIKAYEENFCHILYRIHSRTSPVPSNFHPKTSPASSFK